MMGEWRLQNPKMSKVLSGIEGNGGQPGKQCTSSGSIAAQGGLYHNNIGFI
jgi:hypothetical protein